MTGEAEMERILLVASTGGHLDQLARLRHRFSPTPASVEWVTFDTQQARHVLGGEVVHYVPPVKPKDLAATIRTMAPARAIMGGGAFDAVVSTGAAVALPFMAGAHRWSIGAHYIESAARSDGPSLTGHLVRRLPGVSLYSQYPSWARRRWQFSGSVFDGFTPGPSRVAQIDKVVVTLGTQGGFGFRRALHSIQRLLPALSPGPTILWQTGATDTRGLGIDGLASVPARELKQAIAEADVVIGHAGVGTTLMSLESGRCPVLLPRRRKHNEHTDDHQLQIASELTNRGLAVGSDPDDLTTADLINAASCTVESVRSPPSFNLTNVCPPSRP